MENHIREICRKGVEEKLERMAFYDIISSDMEEKLSYSIFFATYKWPSEIEKEYFSIYYKNEGLLMDVEQDKKFAKAAKQIYTTLREFTEEEKAQIHYDAVKRECRNKLQEFSQLGLISEAAKNWLVESSFFHKENEMSDIEVIYDMVYKHDGTDYYENGCDNEFVKQIYQFFKLGQKR